MMIVFLTIVADISTRIFLFVSFFDYASEVVPVLIDFWVEWVRFSDRSKADVKLFLVVHEAIHDEFRVEMESDLERCFLIMIEVFDDIIKNFRLVLIYANMIDEFFLSMKKVWDIFWVSRISNDVIDNSSAEKLC